MVRKRIRHFVSANSSMTAAGYKGRLWPSLLSSSIFLWTGRSEKIEIENQAKSYE